MLSLLELLHRISVANLLLEYEPPEISGGKRGLRFFRPSKFPIWKFVVHPVAGRRFLRNEALRICHQGSEIARGIINFSSEELWGKLSVVVESGFAKKPMEIRPVVSNMLKMFTSYLGNDPF